MKGLTMTMFKAAFSPIVGMCLFAILCSAFEVDFRLALAAYHDATSNYFPIRTVYETDPNA